METEQKLDHNLYSRQIGAYGVETMGKLIKLRVLVHGLRGVGIETAKNLVLAGPNSVVIHDTTITELRDLGSNFYLTQEDVGKRTRAEACLRQLKELNPYVNVSVYDQELTTDFLANFDIVVFHDFYNREALIKFNKFCRSRERPIGFIVAGNLGLYGYTFVDYGDHFKIHDPNGEEPRSTIVVGITKDKEGQVTVHEDKRHGFVDGDNITFREVQGMTQVNGQVYPIKVLSPFTFTIGDTTEFSQYTREGVAEQVKVPFEIAFKNFEDSLTVPVAPQKDSLELCDWEKFGRPEELHVTLNAIYEFAHRNGGKLPELNSEAHANDLLAIVEELNTANKAKMDIEGLIKLETVNADIVKNVARFAKTQISPLASFWGGIIAQEIVKFTGKFTPLRQWLHYEVFECLPEGNVNRVLTNTRYDDQVAIFGQDLQTKLTKLRLFLVGAGALGCEFIKMFALMGISCSATGKLTCTDDDNIEISNLNRQFLFRKENVGNPKSKTACDVGKRMNSGLNVESLKSLVAEHTEDLFDDHFWENLDAVINAVDNVKARHYIDGRCVFYGKHLFESGTLGTKCNSQIIIPKKTQSYSESQDPPEESIPLCTLKNFPYLIEHTIQWARDFFEGVFVEGPKECSDYLNDPAGYLKKVSTELDGKPGMLRQRLETVKRIATELNKATYETCVTLARNIWQDVFHDMIAQLLHSFPLDYKTESGLPFWSGPKRPPQALNFDSHDEIAFEFVFSASNIFAFIFGLPYTQDRETCRKIVNGIVVKEFVPKKTAIKVNDTDRTEEKAEDDETAINDLKEKLNSLSITNEKKLNLFDFEKDDDGNFHIDFISACANLRARNYKIPEAPKHKVKLIAGKIIPAIATTTAMIVGAVGLEILKFALDKPHTVFRNLFANLALPLWLFSEPLTPNIQKDKDYDPILLGPVKAIPPNFTVWDSITIQGPLTLGEIQKFFAEKYSVNLSLLTIGKTVIYNRYQKGEEAKLVHTPDNIYTKITGQTISAKKKYIQVEVSGETNDMVDCVMPSVKYART